MAQLAPVSGTVEVEKDGKRTPAANALIEVYRTDQKATLPSVKSGKNGEFSFAGLPDGAVFAFVISGPGFAPAVYPNIHSGEEKIVLTVQPGDGARFSETEARKAAAGAAPEELTPEQRKAKAEYEANVKRIEEKNKTAVQKNEAVNRLLKEGSAAFDAKNYELAIAKFTEGYDADPDFVGSAPVMLENKGVALTSRAVEAHNKSVGTTDAEAKVATAAKVKKDLSDAAATFLTAWNILKNAKPEEIVDKPRYEATRNNALILSKDTFKKSVLVDRVDPALIESAKVLLPEYLSFETDAAKKLEAGLILGDLYRLSEKREEAVTAYKAVLEKNPENPDALAGAGLVLVDMSFLKDNDKTLAQEGANYLQKFVSSAPDSHKLKQGAVEYLGLLKAQSITPEKATKRRN